MIVIDINPVLVHLGPLAIRWYGLMYAVGIAAGLSIALPYARLRGLTESHAWSAFSWAFVGGLVGGRLYYVFQQPLAPYLAQPWRIVATWEGGMAFFGAIIGAALALALLAWRRGLPLAVLLDAGALFAALGQAFGRVGNIINGDILGYPTTLPWGVAYLNPGSFAPVKGLAYQPAAAYELLISLALFALLFRLRFRFRRPGMLFAAYLALYSLTQVLVFFLRDNEVLLFGLKQAQLSGLVGMVVAGALALYLSRRGPGAPRRPSTAAQGAR